MQSHLLFRAFLLSVSQHYGDAEAATINPQVFTGLAGLTAQRLRDALGIDGDDAAAIAKILQVHPVFFPRTYVDLSVEVVDDERVRFAIGPCAALDEGDGLTWFAQLGGDADRALDAIVQAVNPRRVPRGCDEGFGAVRLRGGHRSERDAGARGARDRAGQDQHRRDGDVHAPPPGAGVARRAARGARTSRPCRSR